MAAVQSPVQPARLHLTMLCYSIDLRKLLVKWPDVVSGFFKGPEADRYENSSGEVRSGNTLMGINHPISVTASRPRESMVNQSMRQEVSMD